MRRKRSPDALLEAELKEGFACLPFLSEHSSERLSPPSITLPAKKGLPLPPLFVLPSGLEWMESLASRVEGLINFSKDLQESDPLIVAGVGVDVCFSSMTRCCHFC